MTAKTSYEDLLNLLSPYTLIIENIKNNINEYLKIYEPWQLVFGTTLIIFFLFRLWKFLFKNESIFKRSKKFFFKAARRIPFINKKIEAELSKTFKEIEASINKPCTNVSYICDLPKCGMPKGEIIKLANTYKNMGNVDWKQGRCSGTIYDGNNELTELATEIYGMFTWTNPLHSDVFPDIRKMEAEIVRMSCNIFNGNENSCGTTSSGGTESIMLACKVYRDLAYERGIEMPEILCPITAHAAFDKSAQYFCMKIIHIPLSANGAVDIHKMRSKISKRTCVLVGSAPSFPHGIIDPILEIAKLGEYYNIPVHVDCCLGGFIVPFIEKAGYNLEPFDFRVNGVTSISADTHKYGYAPKGSSVILYSDKKYLRKQIFATTDWPGGVYATPTFAGSRSGAIIAGCWATMMLLGENGYVEATKSILKTRMFIEKKIKEIKGLYVIGEPKVTVIGFGSKVFNIYKLSDAMTVLGWNLNALQFPSSIHICLTKTHTQPGVAEKFIEDINNCVLEIMKEPNKEAGGKAAMYGLAQSLPDRSLVEEIAKGYIETCFTTKQSLKKEKIDLF